MLVTGFVISCSMGLLEGKLEELTRIFSSPTLRVCKLTLVVVFGKIFLSSCSWLIIIFLVSLKNNIYMCKKKGQGLTKLLIITSTSQEELARNKFGDLYSSSL